MKKIIFLLLIASQSFATVINVTNPGNGNDLFTNLSAAVSAAAPKGDIIVLPTCSVVITGQITTSKCFSLQGSGIGQTIIIRAESYSDATLSGKAMLIYNINSNAPCGIIVSGITFKSKRPSVNTGGDGLSLAPDRGLVFTNAYNFIVKNCRFENFGNGAIEVDHRDYLAGGVISRSQFYHNYKSQDGLGLGYGVVIYGEGLRWVPNDGFGTDNFIFIEACNFDFHRHSIASAGCARYVARYDTCLDVHVDDASTAQQIHCLDAHDARGAGNGTNTWGGRATEVYNNYLVNTKHIDGVTAVSGSTTISDVTESCIGLRGGASIIYNNYIDGYRFGIEVISTQASDTAVGHVNEGRARPWLGQPGYGSQFSCGQGHTGTDLRSSEGDMYAWSNTLVTHSGGNWAELFKYTQGGSDKWFAIDRDYHYSGGGSSSAKPNWYKQYPYPHPLLKN